MCSLTILMEIAVICFLAAAADQPTAADSPRPCLISDFVHDRTSSRKLYFTVVGIGTTKWKREGRADTTISKTVMRKEAGHDVTQRPCIK